MHAPITTRGRWLLAFALASVAPLASWAFFAIEPDTLDDSFLLAWVLCAVTGLVATGVAAGFVRSVTATVTVWSALTLAVAIVLGPQCGLNMSDVPRGSVVAVIAAASCGIGEPSYANSSGFVVFAGILATAGTAIAAIVGASIRWIMASATPPG